MDLMKAIRSMAVGQILCVHATDSAAAIDIAAWCAMQNHELLAGPAGDGNTYFYIQKGEKSNG
jgi:tRNA 2-thiouridine synthesizing protein A